MNNLEPAHEAINNLELFIEREKQLQHSLLELDLEGACALPVHSGHGTAKTRRTRRSRKRCQMKLGLLALRMARSVFNNHEPAQEAMNKPPRNS